jgi:hypothetical protein
MIVIGIVALFIGLGIFTYVAIALSREADRS